MSLDAKQRGFKIVYRNTEISLPVSVEQEVIEQDKESHVIEID